MTQVINLFGGSGLGKSTLASGLYYEMKMRSLDVELVREYVKTWAWAGIKPGPFDQPYLFGKQCKYESSLYNKVEWIVTDSPLLLAPIYELHHKGESIIEPAAHRFLSFANENGIKHNNFMLTRNKPFDTRGRYETEDEARKVDDLVRAKLTEWNYPFTEVNVGDEERISFIFKQLGIE